MNWFERYGIVGMFFIVMTGMWYFCLFSGACELFSKPEQLKFIGGFCGLSFLPFGYIIMIFSQYCHYCIDEKDHHLHRRYWQTLTSVRRDDIQAEEGENGFGAVPENDEAQIETILTYYDRTKIEHPDVNKFLSEFATKRADVVAINHGLMWAIVFSLIVAFCFCIEGIILDITIKWNTFSVWFMFILALLIFLVLKSSTKTLEEQIFQIGRRKLRDIEI